MNAPNPTRQVTLVGETRARCDLSQTGPPVANELHRPLQSKSHDVAVRSHADRSGKHAREVERAAPGYVCERGDVDGFVQMRDDIVFEPLENVLAQHAACPDLRPRSMTSDQPANESGRNLVPEKRPVRIIIGDFQRQGASRIKERLIIA